MILVTGKGSSGSWQIRGEQLGGAIGAHVQPMADRQTIERADLVIVVKRCPAPLMRMIRQSRKPWVWDILDHFPQPNQFNRDQAIRYLRNLLAEHQPSAVVFPTQAMQTDADWSGPQIVLPHHARPNHVVNPIRSELRIVGYEGSPRYIDGLGLDRLCRRLGLSFVVNPPQLADVDVVLAVRAQKWNGYAAGHWKSNVKLANAHATGTPAILAREAGYLETACGFEHWADSLEDHARRLNRLEPRAARARISNGFLCNTDWSIDWIAREYRAWLTTL